MKTFISNIILGLCFLNAILVFAQSEKIDQNNLSSTNLYNTLKETKSGNWKDVFTDFMQASLKDLTGENKSLQFKANLFALKSKADNSLLIDYNYAREKFSRNFQIEVGLDLDNDYKFKGFNYGFDWAIVNKRDSTVASLTKTETGELFDAISSEIMLAFNKYRNDSNPSDEEIIQLKQKIDKILEEERYVPKDQLPKEIENLVSQNYGQLSSKFAHSFQAEIARIKRQPLLTVGFNSNFQKDSKFFDEYNVQMVYLQGIKSDRGSLEIDFRNKFRAKDSITTSVLKRKEFSSQLGLNISLMKVKDRSIIELKPGFEYTKIFSGLAENEKDNIFTANADLRIRILNNLWLPLILKYDMENNNLFGFLNVSFNFDAIKDE
ncbi:hypothetical protein CHRY9390_01056 [Chryseobacterium aquaeductus]|uniref:DUF3078 domain-containing protein n=1 Tax=Chryseobacterium aquaeductus TaxID=2675056 RepID=A0A9N8QTZ0_9FLAO|nr:hypothetical protein [Chryseobacterium aquaeductus]CAA7330388.1 hypothetical protein CHRY9390_01056 [Chryseobacterium potabilaquae]CAD7803287.1 hypothetical protein CHRY9390_01056 [Chryseobacterium aquaeductus]